MNNLVNCINTHLRLNITLLKTAGIKTFMRRELYLIRSFIFSYLAFYVYRVNLDKSSNYQYLAEDVEFTLLEKPNDLAVLVEEGYDFSPFLVRDDHRLKQEALCLCVFRNKIISHAAWIANSRKAQKSLTDIPCPVAFKCDEAYLGRLERSPRLKRPSFLAIALYLKELEYLQGMGKKAAAL